MSTVDDYQMAIVTKLQTAIPELVSVQPHYGSFNVDDIIKYCNDSPSAYVAIPTLKPGNTYSTGGISMLAETMVVIVSRNKGAVGAGGDAPVICRRIMMQVLSLAVWNAFDAKAMPPTLIEGNELHHDKLDAQGMAMDIASWSAEMLIEPADPFFGREQSRMPDFSFPPLPANAPDDVVVNERVRDRPVFSAKRDFDEGVIR